MTLIGQTLDGAHEKVPVKLQFYLLEVTVSQRNDASAFRRFKPRCSGNSSGPLNGIYLGPGPRIFLRLELAWRPQSIKRSEIAKRRHCVRDVKLGRHRGQEQITRQAVVGKRVTKSE